VDGNFRDCGSPHFVDVVSETLEQRVFDQIFVRSREDDLTGRAFQIPE
jgi:hypothetical protein